jgi:hypothetical protein
MPLSQTQPLPEQPPAAHRLPREDNRKHRPGPAPREVAVAPPRRAVLPNQRAVMMERPVVPPLLDNLKAAAAATRMARPGRRPVALALVALALRLPPQRQPLHPSLPRSALKPRGPRRRRGQLLLQVRRQRVLEIRGRHQRRAGKSLLHRGYRSSLAATGGKRVVQVLELQDICADDGRTMSLPPVESRNLPSLTGGIIARRPESMGSSCS